MVKTNIGEIPQEDYDDIEFFQNGFENQEEVNAEHKAMLEEDKKIAEWQEQQVQKYFAEIEKENVMKRRML